MSSKIRIILAVVFALIVAALGYIMLDLNAQEKLWGHLPMAIFISAWALIITLFSKALLGSEKRKKYFSYSIASSLFLYLGFPTMPLIFTLFVAFVPLFIIEDEISKSEAKPFWKIWRYAYSTFVIWNILATFWVGNTAFAAGIFAILVNAILMTIPFMLYHFTKKILAPNLSALAFIVYWISFEKLHQTWELSWTWLTLGNAFAGHTWMIQWYEFTGAFGGSLWVLLVNMMIFFAYRKKKKLKEYWPIVLVCVFPLFVSLIIKSTYSEKGEEREVCIIQPNFEPHYQKFTIPKRKQLEKFLSLAEKGLSPESDYLLYPETIFRARINDFENVTEIRSLQNLADNFPKLKVVTGIAAHKVFDENEEKPEDTIREFKSGEETIYYESYNGAIQIDQNDSISFYKKSILVPGPEIFPYKNFFFFMKPLVDQLGGTVQGNGTQKSRSVFWDENEEYAIAPVICYESIYGDYCTEYIRKGANAIFIMTNDGWWDNTAGHKQHLLFARLRAIETRRSIARSANTGISSVINQRGDVVSKTKYGEEAAHYGIIKMNDQITFYTLWGDMIARIAFFAAIVFLLNSLVKALMKK